MADLTPYVPRFLLQWESRFGHARHVPVEGTLVFADVSGFTRLSERLAKAGGKIGAEQMADVINALFGELLMVAARRGGEMLKYGGDAVLLCFEGEQHARRAAAACVEMQRRLAEIGRVDTGAGVVRLRMSVGVHSGRIDMFRVGNRHHELVIAGPTATTTCEMEAAADAGEVLLSPATAAMVDERALGAPKAGGRLLRRPPVAPSISPEPVPRDARASSHLSGAVAAHLAEGDATRDHRLATVAFLHLMGLDERLTTEPVDAVAEALHVTMSTIQDALHDLGVTFLATDIIANGTKVMASAGAPVAIENPDERMLRALLRIRDARTPLPVRSGVHRGHVFAGDVGPPYRRTYTTLGDVTNTAARVMGRAAVGEVLSLSAALDHVPRAVASERPAFLAKGKAVPLVPYVVEEIAAAGGRTAASVDRLRVPFVGRADLLAELRAILERAVAGAGSAVELVGAAGIGKTRVTEEVVTGAAAVHRITLRAEPYEQLTPFFAVRHLLRAVLALGRDDVDAASLLAPGNDARGGHLRPWLPLLGDVFDVPVDQTDATEALEGRFRRQRIARLVEEIVTAFTDGPLLLVLEDVHWLDDASGEVLRHLASAAPEHPWLVVATRRPAAAAATAAPIGTTHLLEPLDDAEAAALLDAVTGGVLAPHRQRAILDRADGNPLFLLQLADRHGADDGGTELPESVEEVVAAQVDALSPRQRRLLRFAAVLGASFDAGLVAELDAAAAGEATPTDSGAAIAAELGDQVDVEGGGRLRFRHALVRDVVYEALPFRQRRHLHALAGAALERDGVDEPGVLSLHFFRAEEHAKAWRYGRIAGDGARAKFANVEAVALYERALTASRRIGATVPDTDRAAVLEDLGDAANLAAMTSRARMAYREARRLRLQEDAVAYARLCRKEARIVERSAGAPAAARWLRRGLRAIDGLTTRRAIAERAALWAMYAWMRHSVGRSHDAVRWAERAIAEGRRARDSRTVASAYVILDGAYVALGRPGEAKHAGKALRIYERLGAHADHAVTLINLGAHAHTSGRWRDALDLYRRSREGNLRTGNLLDAGFGALNAAEILVDQGRFDEAERELREVERLWRSVGFALGQSIVEWQLGRLRFRAGRPDDGLELLEGARARFAAAGIATYVLGVETGIVECLLRLGRVEEAAVLVDDAIGRDRAFGGTPSLPVFLRLRGYVLAAIGDVEGAWAAMDESLHLARERSATYDVALALEGFSVLASIRGTDWGPDQEAERRRLLDVLGVVATPPPPLQVAAVP